ncbi:Cysteine-rich secretory protein family protein [Pirellulimonas nuda]|uniref:Cysteine-rich secretory protein family protein n=1 Tax=Pirellulimonas nuda TaxID=2528009 RepID=A0A518D7P3_9BACT|nr:CAP domain-containing protein [Pirellulimonas nuda]QDU87502.1 Cysteine-rich secretory protein family protein [Pirellulimonas nuda]
MLRPVCRVVIATACLICASSEAQVALPDTPPLPALLSRGDGGSIRLTLPRVVMEQKEVQYSVQVPAIVEKTIAGRTVRVTVMQEQVRTKTVMDRKVVGEEVEVSPGQFDVRRASGESIQILSSGRSESRVVPVIVLEVEQIDQPQVPPFLAAVLRPDAVVVFLPVGALAGGPADGGVPNGDGQQGGDAPAPPRPQPQQGQVTLSVHNGSGREVSVYRVDDGKQSEVLVQRSLGDGQQMTPQTCSEGSRWFAKAGDRIVSDFWTPGEQAATWRIGPLVDFTTWDCQGGERFRRLDDRTWRHYDRNGRSIGMLYEEERTDQWVAMYDEGREMWVRLMEDEAIYDSAASNGWQTLAMRAGAAPPVPQPGPAPAANSKLTKAEIAVMLDIHNQARREVGAPPVAWSDGMAQYAQRWADKLAQEGKLEHRQNSPYGENLAMAKTARDAAGMWYGEKDKYGGQKMDNQNFLVFGHYTQMVWSGTAKIGCGKATVGGRTIWVCNYDPPGNKIGDKPY